MLDCSLKVNVYRLVLLLERTHNSIEPTDLIHTHPEHFCIKVFLSVRNRDSRVNSFYLANLEIFHSIRKHFKLGIRHMVSLFRTFGLPIRVWGIYYFLLLLLHGVSIRHIVTSHKVPFLGPKVSKVILNVLYQEPLVAVDTHTWQTWLRWSGTRCTWQSLDRLLNRDFSPRIRRYLHIVMVRWNKGTALCGTPDCTTCIWIRREFEGRF